ncbi:hypothetical protein MSAN_01231800 [Mycena sanguinolenta]|uniref:Uncharacterized protein n=1 Tax=Mycena sanguinolenta TaxID=230812 RepID=A0A8H7D1U4_9AGAR|nr:hypothetical protein MSAN_01231800 [Mycena sanguinolenta]
MATSSRCKCEIKGCSAALHPHGCMVFLEYRYVWASRRQHVGLALKKREVFSSADALTVRISSTWDIDLGETLLSARSHLGSMQ